MEQSAYERSNEALLEAFARARAHVGASNSGLVSDPLWREWRDEARHLKRVLLSRLEGQKPPFKQSDVVQPKTGETRNSVNFFGNVPESVHSADYWGTKVTGPQKIHKIHYAGEGKWLLELEGFPTGERGFPLFHAEEFVAMPSAAVATSER